MCHLTKLEAVKFVPQNKILYMNYNEIESFYGSLHKYNCKQQSVSFLFEITLKNNGISNIHADLTTIYISTWTKKILSSARMHYSCFKHNIIDTRNYEKGDFIKLQMLKAGQGDCFVISIPNGEKPLHILVDGGELLTYTGLKKVLDDIKKENQDLAEIFLTHIDSDHITGLSKLFTKSAKYFCGLNIKQIYYNFYVEEDAIEDSSGHVSVPQANNFIYRLNKCLGRLNEIHSPKIEIKQVTVDSEPFFIGDAKLTILSPTQVELSNLYAIWKENEYDINKASVVLKLTSSGTVCAEPDEYVTPVYSFDGKIRNESISPFNASSIAFMIEHDGKRLLMMGDANPDIVCKSLRNIFREDTKIDFDVIKISHHGGDYSLTEDFLDLVRCSRYIISTSGKQYRHPYKKNLVAIMKKQENVKFYFNYQRDVFIVDDKTKLGFDYCENCSEIEI